MFGLRSEFVLQLSGTGRKTKIDLRVRTPSITGGFGENARLIREFQDSMKNGWVCTPGPKGGGKPKKASGGHRTHRDRERSESPPGQPAAEQASLR
jgi:hypothetical protein